ncbi:RNA polymerase sigma-70 factor [Deminuibacter soli]|uniref:RNA polymerase sigma-70 factor n=1 Tax=Deminuibacter soli TaxID=2291815 RepID=A0A3E1NEK1_9BACT|nr:RNA polymerase sigma-70 factor [Deminuibacter soli]RFM26413.1 RNA polymerase sigma-70 factor [Deminuibacter soli]
MNSERDLTILLKSGDHLAFKKVFDCHARKVYAYAYKFVKNKSQAEDLTQDVFKRLWEKRALLNENKSLNGFLITLCYHAIIEQLRRNKAVYTGLTEGIENEYLAPDNSNAEQLEEREIHSIYKQAINRLPQKRKEIYLLSRHEGMSNMEIASRLNISVKTVENQMTAALQFIRFYFKSKDLLISLLFLFLFLKK